MLNFSGMSFILYPLVQAIFPFISTSKNNWSSMTDSIIYYVLGMLILGWVKGMEIDFFPIRRFINFP